MVDWVCEEEAAMVRVVSLDSEEAATILSYPRIDDKVARSRAEELKKLGVEAIILEGERRLTPGIPVLGKGFSSVVVKAVLNGQVVVIKVRRLDSRRGSLEREGELLRQAYLVGAAPRPFHVHRDFIIMQFIDGIELGTWIKGLDLYSKEHITTFLRDALERARALDKAGIDHGELSRPLHHVILSLNEGRTYIIDYESSSTARKPRNVTSLASGLMLKPSAYSAKLRALLHINTAEAIEALRAYKRHPTDDSFHALLKALKLE